MCRATFYRFARHLASLVLCIAAAQELPAETTPTAKQLDFFESRIRPVLVAHCYECHNSHGTAEGELAVDWREPMRKPTEHGTAIVPGQPERSLLLKVVRHQIDDLKMPDGRPKLGDAVIADLQRWIRMGAPDPRDQPPTKKERSSGLAWNAILQQRKQWWSFQPIRTVEAPASLEPTSPIDSFIRKQLKAHQLQLAGRADSATLLRRLSFVLTGLPPTAEQLQTFLADERPEAYAEMVDRLLASDRFGEQWARHWMDVIRYADSHGSEGDPTIPHAYRYRDYLIRAFNADVPYDQFVREHLAGDLLKEPRINEQLGINESAIGPAHLRMVFHGFAPTDALDEKVRFTDDQINVFSKAFLALTVSCARCHDHKFDPISQRDYYALFGIFGSCRAALIDVNTPQRQRLHQRRLAELKDLLRRRISDVWLAAIDELPERLTDSDGDLAERVAAADNPDQVLYLLGQTLKAQQAGEAVADAWHQIRTRYEQQGGESRRLNTDSWRWRFTNGQDFGKWYAYGNGLLTQPSSAGQFTVSLSGERIIDRIFPAGVYSHTLSTKHSGFFFSPHIHLDDEYQVWLRIAGGGDASVRYAVQNYPRDGTVYPIGVINKPNWYWQRYDLTYWTGDDVHFELATSNDAPLRVRNKDRSWFGVRDVVVQRHDVPAPEDGRLELFGPLLEVAGGATPTSLDAAAHVYQRAISAAIQAWQAGNATDGQALLLDACLREGVLPNGTDPLKDAPRIIDTLTEYRKLEQDIPLPTRVPGVVEGDASDQPLFERGNHRRPSSPVPRRFLEAIDPTPYQTEASGRDLLAESLLDANNPLTARVIVNRVWHYLFGQGLVPTPDNFGHMGESPSHPELLDYLAARFVAQGWSIKQLIRSIVLTDTWQQQSRPSSLAKRIDPTNRWLSHANSRRLEAESIRDALLCVSRELDDRMYGPGDSANSESRRRSIYLSVRRNSLDDFLQTFDAPVPFSTTGRRNETNVPAQSLTMLNDPRVERLAKSWADRLLQEKPNRTPKERVEQMFLTALSRPASDQELETLVEYERSLREASVERSARRTALGRQIAEWEKQLDQLVRPVRQRIGAGTDDQSVQLSPGPIARWDFAESLTDQIGGLALQLHGNAKLVDGALFLDGAGHAASAPLAQSVTAKTLVAQVQLHDLDQRGGGAITLQDLQGTVFDSIVYGERQPRRWMPGSDGFSRTQDVGGPTEQAAISEPVHLAMVYDADGTIRMYRNGEPYGTPYRASAPPQFVAAQSQILFGLRHGQPAASRLLKGRIFGGELFDRPLSEEEIKALATGRTFISEAELVKALSDDQQSAYSQLQASLTRARQELDSLGQPLDDSEIWTRLAHLIFNLKEFIYLR